MALSLCSWSHVWFLGAVMLLLLSGYTVLKIKYKYETSVCPHLVLKPSCPLTLIWLRSWAKAESVCFFRCFPYRPGPDSWVSVGSLCLVWVLRVDLVTGGWAAFLSQLDLDLFIPTPVDSRKKTNQRAGMKHQSLFMSCNTTSLSSVPSAQNEIRLIDIWMSDTFYL